jgi:hypothetical protein
MNYKISEDIRRKIIRLWLDGKSRKDVALICDVSEGTVSNVIADWKQKLDERDADALRQLGINMKRSGTDASQCAQGYRISMILRKMGVNEEDFEPFISKLCERCMKISGLTEDKIGSYLEDLIEFSDEDDNGGNIPKLSEISYYIEQKKNEKRKLKEDIQNLQKQKKISEEEASYANELRDAALENEKTTVTELREYSNFKAELSRCGLSSSIVDDPQKLVRVIYGIKQHGYDVDKVLSDYSDLQIKQIKHDILSNQNRELEHRKMDLHSQCSFFESQVNLHSQRLYVYDELDSMGFGLTKLKIIRNTIKEIAAEENISFSQAVDKFFKFLEQRYDIKLRLKVLEEEEQQKKYTTKPDNLNPTFPSHHDFKPSTALPNQYSLVEKQRQQQMPSTSISYTYTKITNASKKTQEQNDHQLNNDHDDEWYESDDDHSL